MKRGMLRERKRGRREAGEGKERGKDSYREREIEREKEKEQWLCRARCAAQEGNAPWYLGGPAGRSRSSAYGCWQSTSARRRRLFSALWTERGRGRGEKRGRKRGRERGRERSRAISSPPEQMRVTYRRVPCQSRVCSDA